MATSTNLFSFAADGNNTTGSYPVDFGSLLTDAQGNLYGTTFAGGTNGYGTVFELVKGADGTYTETTLFSFSGGSGDDRTGIHPYAGLTADAQGNLYGTAYQGGTNGTGTVYELVKGADGTYAEKTLFSFAAGNPDFATGQYTNATGSNPYAGLTMDAQGNLYGTASAGGTNVTGAVYELVKGADGTYAEKTLFSFAELPFGNPRSNATGANPYAGLTADAQGNLYGTASTGGTNGTGTVYELVKGADGTYAEKTLFSFAANSKSNTTGAVPLASLNTDAQGNLYGTAYQGGTNGTGTVYELVKGADGTYAEKTLFSLAADSGGKGNTTGASPIAGLIADAQGNLYGTTSAGGTNDGGTVYELAKGADGTYTETVLSSLAADPNGPASDVFPYAGLIADAQGNLYGAAAYGGTNGTGAVFRLSNTGFALPSQPAVGDQGGDPGPSTTPTPGPDYLVGTAGNDTIAALAGDDTVNGLGGNDLILGNQGNDLITVGDGANTVLGGMDGDTIRAGAGPNVLLGNEGNDVITAGSGTNTVYGGMGNDVITVGDGGDLMFGGEGADTVTAGDGNNTIVGGSANPNTDSLDGADYIRSGSGNDFILGNGGNDTIGAGAGNDTAVGGTGDDVILGQQGDDFILGNQGNDTLVGGMGNDTLVGGQGNDVLYGNQGDDVLYGNEGLNTFVFNPGDTDFKSGQSTGDTVMDFVTGTSRIDFASGPAGTAADFGTGSTAAKDFASAQAVAQGLIDSGDSYAFVSNGTDGYLFTTGGTGTAITDAVKLVGAGTPGAVKFTDIAHGALA